MEPSRNSSPGRPAPLRAASFSEEALKDWLDRQTLADLVKWLHQAIRREGQDREDLFVRSVEDLSVSIRLSPAGDELQTVRVAVESRGRKIFNTAGCLAGECARGFVFQLRAERHRRMAEIQEIIEHAADGQSRRALPRIRELQRVSREEAAELRPGRNSSGGFRGQIADVDLVVLKIPNGLTRNYWAGLTNRAELEYCNGHRQLFGIAARPLYQLLQGAYAEAHPRSFAASLSEQVLDNLQSAEQRLGRAFQRFRARGERFDLDQVLACHRRLLQENRAGALILPGVEQKMIRLLTHIEPSFRRIAATILAASTSAGSAEALADDVPFETDPRVLRVKLAAVQQMAADSGRAPAESQKRIKTAAGTVNDFIARAEREKLAFPDARTRALYFQGMLHEPPQSESC